MDNKAGWLLFCTLVSAIFCVYQYQAPDLDNQTQAIVNQNLTYKEDLVAYHKDLTECMMALPEKTRNEIYRLHREELAWIMKQKRSQSLNISPTLNDSKPSIHPYGIVTTQIYVLAITDLLMI